MGVRATGTLGWIYKGTTVDFDAVRGTVLHKHFASVGDNLIGLHNQFYNDNVSHVWERSLHTSTLTATISGGQDGLPDDGRDNWQLLGNEAQKDLFSSGICARGIAGDSKFASKVEDAYSAFKEGDTDSVENIRSFVDPSVVDQFDAMMFLLSKHVDSFAFGQYVLRHSISISNFYTGSLPGDGSVERLWTTDALLTTFESIPPYLSQKMSSIPAPDPLTGTLWSWRQLPSTAATAAQNRIDVSTEWWLDLWSTDLYATA